MKVEVFKERVESKDTWQKPEYAYKTFASTINRLAQASSSDKQEALLQEALFFLSYTSSRLYQSLEYAYDNLKEPLRTRFLTDAQALQGGTAAVHNHVFRTQSVMDVDGAMMRLWAGKHVALDHYLWERAEQLLKMYKTDSNINQRWLAAKVQKSLLVSEPTRSEELDKINSFYRRGSEVLTAVADTPFFDAFADDEWPQGWLNALLKIIQTSTLKDAEKMRRMDIILDQLQGEDKDWERDQGKILEAYALLQAKHFQPQAQRLQDMFSSQFPPKDVLLYRCLAAGGNKDVLERFSGKMTQGHFKSLLGKRLRNTYINKAPLEVDLLKALLELHKDDVWLSKTCADALINATGQWGASPKADIVGELMTWLQQDHKIEYLKHCAERDKVRLMKKAMKNVDVDTLAALRENMNLWNERARQNFTQALSGLEKKELTKQLDGTISGSAHKKRRM